jgi:hypothetical protein
LKFFCSLKKTLLKNQIKKLGFCFKDQFFL